MLSFKTFMEEYLSEGANMLGTIGSERKGLGHVKNYVMPFLSKEGRAKTVKSLGGFGNVGSADSHGEHHDPKATSTHTLHAAANGHAAGTKVKVTHVTKGNGDDLHAHTESHGVIPLAKLQKPESLRKAPVAKEGFDVEGKIANNLGVKAAGSTKHGYDYQYSSSGAEVRGKVKEVAAANQPQVRGESKLDKGKMGQSVFKHSHEKGWHFSNEEIGNHFAKAKVKGPDGRTRSMLSHFNKFHSDGKIDKQYKIEAPAGSTRNYLNSGGKRVNSLHIHDKKSGSGTTYTVGKDNELHGKTKLGHLHDEHLDALDGHIAIEPTSNGKTTAVHRPKPSVMKAYAQASKNDPANHRDLTNPEHAKEFRKHVDSIKG